MIQQQNDKILRQKELKVQQQYMQQQQNLMNILIQIMGENGLVTHAKPAQQE